MSESALNAVERLKREQAKLEELLFLVDRDRRPRVEKMLAHLRAQIAGLEAVSSTPVAPKSLQELRQRQSDLEESLFVEPPERRPHIKKLLAQVRAEIETALTETITDDTTTQGGPSQVA